MSKIKTTEKSYDICERVLWNHLGGGYVDGIAYTKQGIIDLILSPREANAIIIYNQKEYNLRANQPVTKLGWARIAKRWAKKIWAQK